MPGASFTRWMRIRLLTVVAMLVVLGLVILYRIWTLQVAQSEWLQGLAKDQYLKKIALEPMRGEILDRNGSPLAVSIMTDSVFVMPVELDDPKAAADKLAASLGLDAGKLRRTLQKRKHFTWIKRRIPPAEAQRVRDLDLAGVHMTRESRRYYPAREMAAAMIGFAGDGRGLEGLELMFDGRLRGSTVMAQGLKDARGNVLFAEGVGVGDGDEGIRLMLTLDLKIQDIVERELERAVRENGARSGVAVVMDPHTGEVLAMATSPSYNPNSYWEYGQARYRNRAVTDCFEPGSTMKVFSLAGALQKGVVKPGETFDCGRGRLQIGRHTIHDHGRPSNEDVPLDEVLIQSKNTCTAMIAFRLGKEALWQNLHDYGFGRETGIQLPGETRCRLRPFERWSDLGLATISFGQGVSVTALQLTTALSAVANGGVWLRPKIVREIQSADGKLIRGFEVEPAGRVLDERWAREMTRMMVGVTGPGGTGTRGRVPGFSVAGKTGTAQKADPVTGGYSKDKRVASFMGFIPAENPRLSILVVIDEPQTSPYGGTVAAPVFSRIAQAALPYLGVYPEGGSLPTRDEEIGEDELDRLVAQLDDGVVLTSDEAEVLPDAKNEEQEGYRLPSLLGLSAREALRQLNPQGFEVIISGSGRVIAQDPRPGAELKAPARISLTLGVSAAGSELAGKERELAAR